MRYEVCAQSPYKKCFRCWLDLPDTVEIRDFHHFMISLPFFLSCRVLPHDLKANELRLMLIPGVDWYFFGALHIWFLTFCSNVSLLKSTYNTQSSSFDRLSLVALDWLDTNTGNHVSTNHIVGLLAVEFARLPRCVEVYRGSIRGHYDMFGRIYFAHDDT